MTVSDGDKLQVLVLCRQNCDGHLLDGLLMGGYGCSCWKAAVMVGWIVDGWLQVPVQMWLGGWLAGWLTGWLAGWSGTAM